MDKLYSSDKNPTMLASSTFDAIIKQIQTSHLNFHLQISPFSAIISLKKTLIKDKSGTFLLPPTQALNVSKNEIAALASKNLMLENKAVALQKDLENAVDDSEAAHIRIKSLLAEIKPEKNAEDALTKELLQKNELINNFKVDLDQLTEETYDLKQVIENKNENIKDLETSNKVQKEINDKLNKEISESKVRFNKEKELMKKEHRAEVKSLRLELGDKVKEKIKLEDILKGHLEQNSAEAGAATPAPTLPYKAPLALHSDRSMLSPSFKETMCSICASPIPDYVPKYLLGEKFNPACDSCDDSYGFDDDVVATQHIEDGVVSVDAESTAQNKVVTEAVVKAVDCKPTEEETEADMNTNIEESVGNKLEETK